MSPIMSHKEFKAIIKQLSSDQVKEIYKYYAKDQIFHTYTTYDSDGIPYSDLYVHENLMNLLPTTKYEVNEVKCRIRHRIFDEIEGALPFLEDRNNVNKIKESVLDLYVILATVKTRCTKFDNKMREIAKQIYNKSTSFLQ
jgi:hypothetical protein